MNNRIYLSLAHMSGHEQEFIKEAFDTNWVVPLGPNVDAFEKSLSDFLTHNSQLSTLNCVALSSGTAAIHLGLVLMGVQPGDEVICQSFTFAASANPIAYLEATPVFVDSERDTWNMDPVLLEEAIKDRLRKTGKLPKAIIPVHLYGMPAKMDEIMAIANRYDIPVLEDAAEALGSTLNNRNCGVFGELGVLSFNGNKMITTSGGGALICRTEEEAKQTKFYATQARDNAPHYQHSKVGYNYRMSNICAGIGRGQMFVLEEHIARRREIHDLYTELLKDVPGVNVMQNPSENYKSNFWLTCILVDPAKAGKTREDIRLAMDAANIETRPLWKPLHLQPVFANAPFYGNGTSEHLFDIGLCLPSGPTLTNDDIRKVVEVIKG
ncbi:DegT/DnrJ/EryC1/StrS aminotransferase family protein [Bacteroides sp. 519]|uniref:DegT/DnrJ/EryC1/StrS family aminotransferase n=1 Tax=Bacteroides sp. 519 TaxID=2302937 RepID=UPI0013D85A3D|nr:aminotransferase class I/II-fold pyridoxal phosphate-dependent enzyme [Bacteroides sp. 519]NDV58993.1 aminotransferase class I/II-fold pyridoxal phosphate-dependent enzyme [Bacteroides sp. 519]